MPASTPECLESWIPRIPLLLTCAHKEGNIHWQGNIHKQGDIHREGNIHRERDIHRQGNIHKEGDEQKTRVGRMVEGVLVNTINKYFSLVPKLVR